MARKWLMAGAILAGIAVVAGAFGAHALEGRLQETGTADTYDTAVTYHMYHALAILVIALLLPFEPTVGVHQPRSPLIAAWLFTIGIVLFSGSLYLYSLTGAGWLAAITPFGGTAFIAGWVFFAIAAAGAVRGGR